MQKNAIQSVLLQIQGIGEVEAEQAVNAALSAISETVNGALGWVLL